MQQYYISKDNARSVDDIPVVLLTLNALSNDANIKINEPFTFITPLSEFELDKVYSFCFHRGYLLNKA